MRKSTKRKLAAFLCSFMVFTMTADPIATIAGFIVESGAVDRFVNLKNNLIYISESGFTGVVYATESGTSDTSSTSTSSSCSCDFSCDASSAVSALMGKTDTDAGVTLKDLNSSIQSTTAAVNSGTSTLNTAIGDVNTSVTNGTNTLNSAIGDVNNSVTNGTNTINTTLTTSFTALQGSVDTIKETTASINSTVSTISTQLSKLQETIEAMQHNYRVAHLFSLNNELAKSLWRPTTDELPYLTDLATVTGSFANVYTGYWDSSVSTLSNENTAASSNGKQYIKRAYEVLGYDATVVAEGVILNKEQLSLVSNSSSVATGLSEQSQAYVIADSASDSTKYTIATLYQEYIPEENIRWIDAVTLLYKALGQEQITYQSFMSHDSAITPETSPAYQNLSNPVPDAETGKYAGYDLYMFFTRANPISKTQAMSGEEPADGQIEYIYWEQAINDGFIPSDYVNSERDAITFASFMKLAARMMQAYGEPVMNDDELQALLQVYGTNYPIQLGTEIADAWAYLAARGIFDFNEINEGEEAILYSFSASDTISRDQLLVMCMRIKDDDSRTDYKEINITLDLSDVMKADYYFPVSDLAIAEGQFSSTITVNYANASSYDYLIRKDAADLGDVGTPTVYAKVDDTSALAGATYNGIVEIGGNNYYSVSVPIDYNDTFYIKMLIKNGADKASGTYEYIEVPGSLLGGGIYPNTTAGSGYCTVKDTGRQFFDECTDVDTVYYYTDYKRAGKEDPAVTTTASNSTVLERVACLIDYWTTPMTAYADTTSSASGSQTVTYKIRFDSGQGQAGVTTFTATDKDGNDVDGINDTNIANADAATSFSTDPNWEEGAEAGLWKLSDYPNVSASADATLYSSDEASTQGLKLKVAIYDSSAVIARNLDRLVYMSYANNNSLDGYADGSSVKTKLKDVLTSDNNDSLVRTAALMTSTKYSTKFAVTSRALIAAAVLGEQALSNGDSTNTSNDRVYGGIKIVTDSDTSAFTTTETLEVNKDAYSIIADNIDSYISDDEDTLLAKWISAGITKVTRSNSTWSVTGSKSAVEEMASDLHDTDSIADIASSAAASSGNTATGYDTNDIDLSSSIATTAIMSRTEQILISWSDLVDSGFVTVTSDSGWPEINEETGAYTFMTQYGQVIVNPSQYTIQIGTTLYDLYYTSGTAKSPQLVYVWTQDNSSSTNDGTSTTKEQEMYFDYRCVMGLISDRIIRNDTQTTAVKSSLGSGSYVVYDIGYTGINTDLFSTTAVNVYNIPETESTTSVSASLPTTMNIITKTGYDDVSDSSGYTYWEGRTDTTDVSQINRISLSSFCPIANWVVVIDDDGSNTTGSVYVYYLLKAFEDYEIAAPDNFAAIFDNTVDVGDTGLDKAWELMRAKLSDAELNVDLDTGTLTNTLTTIYGYDFSSDTMPADVPWYVIMSAYSVSQLAIDTSGKMYLSGDYIVRQFNVSKNSVSSCYKWGAEETASGSSAQTNYTGITTTSNDTGAYYWIDGIGLVYNLPTTSEFTLEAYLKGELMLPLALKADSTSPSIYNYNINYFGSATATNNTTYYTKYGTVLNPDPDYDKENGTVTNAYINYNGEGTAMLYKDEKNTVPATNITFPAAGNSDDKNVKVYPFNTEDNPLTPDDSYFIPAPVAIYARFAGNDAEKMTVGDLTRYITDSDKIYYGSSIVSFDSQSTLDQTTSFYFVSDNYNSIKLSNTLTVYRVFRKSGQSVFVIESGNALWQPDSSPEAVNSDDFYTDALTDWLDGLGANDLLTLIDEGASFLIVFTFRVMPMLGVILMTILVGLAFLCDNQVVQMICDKTIDPVRLLTFGNKDIHTWHWRKVLIPCIVLYIAFALFLNGNVIRIIMWGAEWYGTIMQWIKQM